MKRIKIGDVFEIETPKGMGYFQYVYVNPRNRVELIRVFSGVYPKEPQDMAGLVSQKEAFLVQYMARYAYREKVIRLVGNYMVPPELKLPPKQMKTTDWVRGQFICWRIVDYETLCATAVKESRLLTNEQKKLSPASIWPDSVLIEKIMEGWTPEKWSEDTSPGML